MTDETPQGCGCPPTVTSLPLTGGVHHVILTVNNLARARRFYSAVMPKLGYPTAREVGGGRSIGWLSSGGSFWIKEADPRYVGASFSKDRVGLSEVAFRAESRAQVDALARDLVTVGGTILDPPREYPEYVPGYYAVFFADPDGIKLELVHIPG